MNERNQSNSVPSENYNQLVNNNKKSIENIKAAVKIHCARVFCSLGKFNESIEYFESVETSALTLYDKITFGVSLLRIDSERSLKIFSDCYQNASSEEFLLQLFVKVLFQSGNSQLAKRQLMSILSQSPNVEFIKMGLVFAIKDNDKQLTYNLIDRLLAFPVENRKEFVGVQLFMDKIYKFLGDEKNSKLILSNAIFLAPYNLSLWKQIDPDSALQYCISNQMAEEFSSILQEFDSPPLSTAILSILTVKYSPLAWKQLAIAHSQSLSNRIADKFIESFKVFDEDFSELMLTERKGDSSRIEQFFDKVHDNSTMNLGIRILFRSFGSQSQLLQKIIQQLPFENLAVETQIEIFCGSSSIKDHSMVLFFRKTLQSPSYTEHCGSSTRSQSSKFLPTPKGKAGIPNHPYLSRQSSTSMQ